MKLFLLEYYNTGPENQNDSSPVKRGFSLFSMFIVYSALSFYELVPIYNHLLYLFLMEI